ncbi:Atu4866 domain-containing protein [Streptomyces prasinus]|uniref:Atu4866 domain-containing protein n=1 Tax=Streptomyces TaxID=1883 RepID=UPI003317AC62
MNGQNSPVGGARETRGGTTADVVGMWVTADGHIRQELLADGRYDEARGTRRSAYTGRYTVSGGHIDYVDDTGFTATGDIRDGVLYHEHLVLHREERD